ncbi:hypothetical protein GQ457_12G032240 [Hibiscus cannabinus]
MPEIDTDEEDEVALVVEQRSRPQRFRQVLFHVFLASCVVFVGCFSAILNKQLELRISHQWKSWLIISYKSISIESNKLENFEILRFFHFPVLDERLEVRRPSEQAMWQAHRGRVSCKRDFPPFCGRHAPPLKSSHFYNQSPRISHSTNSTPSFSLEIFPYLCSLFTLKNFKILRFLHFPVLDERLEVHRPSEQAMWQAHQGRVSCKRDFPPFCGRHAPPLRRHSERAMRQADHRKRVSCERHFPPFGGRHAPPLERHSVKKSKDVFICEYVGEVLEDSEAEKRTGNGDYLFDIGNSYGDSSPQGVSESFTIDAARFVLDERLEVRRPSEQAMWQAHRGRVSCKRDFPPFCGRHAPPLKRHSERAMRQADHRKRVSCERHFPPFCGRHAPPLKRHSVKKSKDVKYVGEVLEDSEAEKRTGNGDYLFDIGNSYGDSSPQGVSESFTIDAARFVLDERLEVRRPSEQAMWQAHRGRVSCKRDFPPFCGRHAPPLKRHSERAMRQADHRKREAEEQHSNNGVKNGAGKKAGRQASKYLRKPKKKDQAVSPSSKQTAKEAIVTISIKPSTQSLIQVLKITRKNDK